MKLIQLSAGCVLLCALCALPASAQTINEDIKIVASDAASPDFFGYSVAISGTTTIVGAYQDGGASGSAYLFDTLTGQELFKLTASDTAEQDRFGYSVAISGTKAIIGAHQDDDAGNNSGSAYLFDTQTGIQIAKLTASDAASFDQFGHSVAISGTTAIVGAHNDNGVTGSAYLFDTLTGQELFKLTASDAAAGDLFGYSVAISGTTAIVGAWANDDHGPISGSAYLFDTVTGLEIAKLTASDAAASDFFGESVAISGTTAIVGAFGDDDAGGTSGSAYLFDTQTGIQIAKLTASDAAAGDLFGDSVAISDGNVIVGANGDDVAGSSAGSAYLFDFSLNILQQPQGTIVTAGEAVEFSVPIQDETGVGFQWRRNGIDLVNGGNISGTQSSTLQIIASEDDEAYYDCVVTDVLEITSDQVILAVMPDPNECVVDLNGDGSLNFLDVSAFLAAFGAGCP